ncbi:uncharacterized protein DUF560 [Mesocricetibacter intestinalis]|uniref:Uncharacterized protein DUF560 n=1 Tax=Mesocricetibacter intestinalis TaxID=1521930 RepID=A0A4R6VBN6_9PAST|nr:surface lipoprotein assembly modifier [Mesocricetibacter intestinalis]TDQ59698.1 uncharacterized protein DUF560 [Mesocricetibacter intestinalis]
MDFKLKKTLFFTLCALFCRDLAADQIGVQRERLPNEDFSAASPHLNTQPKNEPIAEPQTGEQTVSITAEELAQRPDLLVNALVPALVANNVEGVALLLPIYQNLPAEQQDPLLLTWAQAMVAKRQGDLSTSVDLYRKIIAERPDLTAARLQLAIALFNNLENEAAQDQFNRLRSEALPDPLRHLVNAYLQGINQRDKWNFNGGLTYLHEANINNAPKAGTQLDGWRPGSRPEDARGVGYAFSGEKKWSLSGGSFSLLGMDFNGKHYWNNRKYNELSLRTQLGLGYRNLQSEISFAPFVENYWYAGGESSDASKRGTLHRYSRTSGVRTDMSRWLNNRWKISSVLEYGEARYPVRKSQNGNSYSASAVMLYIPNSNQYWFGGIDYYRKNAQAKYNAFDRKGIRLGWGQEWPFGISTRLQLTYAERNYKEAYFVTPFHKFLQKNREYGSFFTLWHRQLHFGGITPKLTWSYHKTSSNNPFSAYDKNRVYLELSKYF